MDAFCMRATGGCDGRRQDGFTLVELLVVVAIIGVLVSIAYPGYQDYVRKASRTAAQSELQELAALQEKIYLNSNQFSSSVDTAYTGTATGGLGKTAQGNRLAGQTEDRRYVISVVTTSGQSFVLTATPVAGGAQDGDGAISLSSTGSKTCDNTKAWCPNGRW